MPERTAIPVYGIPLYAIPFFAVPVLTIEVGPLIFEAVQVCSSLVENVQCKSTLAEATEIVSRGDAGLQVFPTSIDG